MQDISILDTQRRKRENLVIEHSKAAQNQELNTQPFVSIIVPAKNNESQIGSCIKSLMALDYPKDRYEIIIADGDSKDRTALIARSYGAAVVEEDGGCRASGCNVGFQHSRGEYIAFTDADCIVDKDWLNNALKYFKEGVAGVGGPNFPPEGAPKFTFSVHYALLLSPLTVKFRSVESVRSFAGCNCVYKKQLVERFFPLPLTKGGEDTLLNFRITEEGYKLLSAPDMIVWHDRHYKTPSSFLKQMQLYGESAVQLERKMPGMLKPLQKLEGISLPVLIVLGLALFILNPYVFLLTFLAFCLFFVYACWKVFRLTRSFRITWLIPEVLVFGLVGFSIGYIKETLFPGINKGCSIVNKGNRVRTRHPNILHKDASRGL